MRTTTTAIALAIAVCSTAAFGQATQPAAPDARGEAAPRIQIAILLDNSGSMGGLIDQARTQLWKIVNQFATTRHEGQIPNLEVALYKYGESGPVRLVPLTTDLDRVSEALFAIPVSGGTEKCGETIDAATKQLAWSESAGDYKAVFIAGNEPFTQGDVDYVEACKAAIGKGIIVNTIHCGDEQTGINTKWKHGAELADGAFMVIDHTQAVVHVATPFDDELAKLNSELNGTYIAYGARGRERAEAQAAQDANAAGIGGGAGLDRAAAKASVAYKNAHWDLVDAADAEGFKLEDLKAEDLPEAMREMSLEEREAYIAEHAAKRAELREQIKSLAAKRNGYIAKERQKQAEETGEETLGDAMLRAVNEQLNEKGYERAE